MKNFRYEIREDTSGGLRVSEYRTARGILVSAGIHNHPNPKVLNKRVILTFIWDNPEYESYEDPEYATLKSEHSFTYWTTQSYDRGAKMPTAEEAVSFLKLRLSEILTILKNANTSVFYTIKGNVHTDIRSVDIEEVIDYIKILTPEVEAIPVDDLAWVEYYRYNLYSAYKFLYGMFYGYDIDLFEDDEEFLQWLNSK